MFYSNDVQDSRKLFFSSWAKYCNKQPLEMLEKQIVDVILAHPEYHSLFESCYSDTTTYFPELGQTNPFLHMGLHLALRDQVNTDRPVGIKGIFQQLLIQLQDVLSVEHQMMECLIECLWLAQKNQTMPDEKKYLSDLQSLVIVK